MTKIWRHCVYAVANSKFYSLRSNKCALYESVSNVKSLVNSNLDLEEIFVRGVTSGERFKKNFYCSVYEVISQRKWPNSYVWRLAEIIMCSQNVFDQPESNF